MNSNCSVSNENILQYTTNFRIYKYQWNLQPAEYLPGRERWANLHFLRLKWEMFRVYGKTYLFQLTYTITCYMSLVTWQCYNNLETRAQGVSLTFLSWVMTYVALHSLRFWSLNIFVFTKGTQAEISYEEKSKVIQILKIHIILSIFISNCYIPDSHFLA